MCVWMRGMGAWEPKNERHTDGETDTHTERQQARKSCRSIYLCINIYFYHSLVVVCQLAVHCSRRFICARAMHTSYVKNFGVHFNAKAKIMRGTDDRGDGRTAHTVMLRAAQ